MTYLWAIVPILQIFFAIHAYRHGNIFWIFVILFFPGIGVIVYLFAEFLPSLRQGTGVGTVTHSVARRLLPSREIQRLQDQISLNNSVNNRLALAKCYLENGQPENAIPVFEDCLSGAYQNDPDIMVSLSKAYFMKKSYKEALDKLLSIPKGVPTVLDKEVQSLIARAHDELGDTDTAIREYASIVDTSTGEEMRCRYALALKRAGRTTEAAKLFATIVRNAKTSPGFYRASQKEWIRIARTELRMQSKSGTR